MENSIDDVISGRERIQHMQVEPERVGFTQEVTGMDVKEHRSVGNMRWSRWLVSPVYQSADPHPPPTLAFGVSCLVSGEELFPAPLSPDLWDDYPLVYPIDSDLCQAYMRWHDFSPENPS